MCNIKVLDCTLRDGGYINNWNFDYISAKSIISALNASNIDMIEVGFLTNKTVNSNQSKFNSFSELENIISNIDITKLYVMIKYGDFDIKDIPDKSKAKVINIRLIFKKHQQENALKFAESLIGKGYNVFLNPTFCTMYTNNELELLIKKINLIKPKGFTLVDSSGSLNMCTIETIFYMLDTLLNEDISMGFHFHNNLNLAFNNAKSLLLKNTTRSIIIDSTLAGIGRGAGNIQTQELCKYLNLKLNTKYDIYRLTQTSDKYIKCIKKANNWGCTAEYYWAAINNCHPDYAKFLLNNSNLDNEQLNKLFKSIPQSKKDTYDGNLITTLFSSMKK